MRVLLVGEFSGIHWALAEGLRHLGHEVCVVSNGNGWKNYPRDIDLKLPRKYSPTICNASCSERGAPEGRIVISNLLS